MAEFKFSCPQCGQQIEADESFRGQTAECPYCGRGVVIPTIKPVASVSGALAPQKSQAIPRRGFGRYFTSKGRAPRKEFWISSFLPIPFTGLLGSIRRLHDLNKCEWWLLAPIACCVAAKTLGMEGAENFTDFMCLAWLITLGSLDGTSGDNDYGPDPKGRMDTGRKTPAAAIAIPILTAVTVVGTLLAMLVNSQMQDSPQPESADGLVQSTPAVRQEAASSQEPEMTSDGSADRQIQDSHDAIDMVTVDGVIIRRLPGDEFEKITNVDGDETFSAALPEDDGFTAGINIQSFDLGVESKDLPKTPQQMKEFMDMYVFGTLKEVKKNQDIHADIEILDRKGNSVTFLMEFDAHCGYQKHLIDVRNGRGVIVTGLWKLNKDKKTIKRCVDSAHLAEQ